MAKQNIPQPSILTPQGKRAVASSFQATPIRAFNDNKIASALEVTPIKAFTDKKSTTSKHKKQNFSQYF
jgi:hypothetical protein